MSLLGMERPSVHRNATCFSVEADKEEMMYYSRDAYEKCPYKGTNVLITIQMEADMGFGCSVDYTEPEFSCQYQSDCICAYRDLCLLSPKTAAP